MVINVTEGAAKWYVEELEMNKEGFIRFFPRYGFGGHIPGFSIGISQDSPDELVESTVLEGITFYIEAKDEWYFEDVDLHVTLNEKLNEPKYVCE